MLQLKIFHNAHAWIASRCTLILWGKEGHWAIAYTSTMCLDFYVTVEHEKNKFIHAPIRFYDLHQLYLIIKFT